MKPRLMLALGLVLGAAACDGSCSVPADDPLKAPAVRVIGAIASVFPTGNGAAYLELANEGEGDDRLVSVASPCAADVQLHETVIEDDVARMREATRGFSIEAGSRLSLAPGGKHLMLFGVELPSDATTLPLVLQLERSGSMRLEVPLATHAGLLDSESTAKEKRQLRVCADPNNMPFSNDRGEGFENRLAELVASDLGLEVVYEWRPQRRGFLRETLKAKRCDVVMGVPSRLDMVATTLPYYRSGYVFVYGVLAPRVRSLYAPQLSALKIGVPVVGDDAANVPPVDAIIARRGAGNLRGYSIYGDYREESPPSALIQAVRSGEVDLAIAWGPLAGYYAKRGEPRLALSLVPESEALPSAPFAFDLSMGVRREDKQLRRQLNDVIERRRSDIEALLHSYDVPLLELPTSEAGGSTAD